METGTHELAAGLHTLSRSLRLIRQRGAEVQPTVRAGLLGVLVHVAEPAAGCHGRDLALRTGLDPSTISRAVSSLVAHGWVERDADPVDGRAHVLRLTAAGRAALEEARGRYVQVLERALAGWEPADVAALSAALARLSADIDHTLGHPDTAHPDTLEAAR